jgi:integrase
VPNPAARKKLQEPEGRVRWLEQAEAVRLIQSAAGIARAPWLVDFVQLALNTGCRVGELLRLEWARVDLRANLAILNPGNTKNGKRRSVPLNESAREAMLSRARYRAEHCPASPWVFCRKDGRRLTTVKRSFKAALKLAGMTTLEFTTSATPLRYFCFPRT